MRSLCLFSFLTISFFSSALALPSPVEDVATGVIDPDVTKIILPRAPEVTVTTKRNTYDCDGWAGDIEAQAWNDALRLAKEGVRWEASKTHQQEMDMWMGKDSIKDDYKDKIKTALENEVKVHEENAVLPNWYVISVFCGDKHKSLHKKLRNQTCKKERNGKTVYPFATSFVDRGWVWNDYYIVLCPRFFAEKDSLMRTLARMSRGDINPRNASAYKFTWGHTYYHELMHLDPVVSAEDVGDVVYGACGVADLAKNRGCSKGKWKGQKGASSLLNADSWAMFASSVYIRAQLKLDKPGEADCSTAQIAEAADDDNPESIFMGFENREESTFNLPEPRILEGGKPPVSNLPTIPDTFDPNAPIPSGIPVPHPEAAEYFENLGKPKTHDVEMGILTCRSENNDFKQGDRQHFLSLEQMNKAVADFCAAHAQTKDSMGKGRSGLISTAMQGGGVVTVEYIDADGCPPPFEFAGNEQTCKDRLSVPINGCDTTKNDQEYWKQGGRFFRDCLQWEIATSIGL